MYIIIEDRGYGIEYPYQTASTREEAETLANQLNELADNLETDHIDGDNKPYIYYIKEEG